MIPLIIADTRASLSVYLTFVFGLTLLCEARVVVVPMDAIIVC